MAIQKRDEMVSRRWHVAAAIPDEVLEPCSVASLQIAGPTLRSLAVTSATRGEGRTTVAMAMATAQVRDYGRHPLLLEMDFDRPGLSRRLHTEVTPGLAELIRGETSIEEAAQPLAEGLTVITAGAAGGAAARLVVDLSNSGLLQDLTKRFDVIIADLPPLLASTYGRLAAGLLERTLLVIRAGVTPVASVQEAVATLASEPVVILNGTSTRLPRWLRRLAPG